MSELSPEQLRAIVFGQGASPAALGGRRHEARYWNDGTVKFKVTSPGHPAAGREHKGHVMDSSIHGLRFRTALSVNVGDVMRVEFSPSGDDSPIITDATVVRVDETPAGFEVGVVFEE